MLNDPIDSAIDDLASDLERTLSMLQQDDTQFCRRMYVRSLFAYLESFTYWMRQNAIDIDLIVSRRFGFAAVDWERHFLLHEEFPTITDTGKVEKTRQKFPFKNRFAFSMRAYFDIVKCKDNLFSHDGWRQIQKAMTVRDRLTHPKQSNDLVVSDVDLKSCREGYVWFTQLVVTKFKESYEAMIKDR